MSYDLFFRPSRGTGPSPEELLAYFDGRARYRIEGTEAWYQNDDTGVYFVFEVGDQEEEEAAGLVPVAFNLNYVRPHVFGLEAELELARFVAHFDLLVRDPQTSGAGEGAYSAERFLRGWDAGNELACRAGHRTPGDAEVRHLPRETLDRVWRWNYTRDELYEQLEQDLFVPRILFAEHDGRLKLAVVWPDAIATVLPEVDLVILGRQALAPRRMFRSRPDHAVVSFDAIRELISDFPLARGVWPYRTMAYDAPPRRIADFVRRQPRLEEGLGVVAPDAVLDSELFLRHHTA